LCSPDEAIIESPTIMRALPRYLEEKLGVEFLWNTAVTSINYPNVRAG
jgi:hypothetical protein